MAGKTIGELMEEMRIKAGAKEYHGHSYMGLIIPGLRPALVAVERSQTAVQLI